MLLTFDQARAAALAIVAGFADEADAGPIVLVDSLVREFDEGWVFSYQSARFLETEEFGLRLVGNAPIFVPRDGRPARIVGYHRPLEESMAAWRCCEDPNAPLKAEITFVAPRPPRVVKIQATHAIRRHSALGLGDAKWLVDAALEHVVQRVPASSLPDASALVAALRELGWQADPVYGR